MHWFRSTRRPAGWLALLALVLQLALSFGHVHELPSVGPETALAASAGAGGNAAAPGHPSQGGHHDNDYCAICAVLALLTGAQTATAPAVPPPLALATEVIVAAAETAPVVSRPTAFRSRAPPIS